MLGIVLFALALWWLHHVLGQYRWQDILLRLRAIRATALVMAALLAVAGYAWLTLYELLGVRFAGARMPYFKIALISFMAYAVGHNVGLNAVSGGAIRFRAYSGQGLKPKQIATVVAFGSITFALGSAFLLGLSLLANGETSGLLLHLNPTLVVVSGTLLLAAVLAYFVLAFMRRESLRIGPFVVPVLKPHVAFAQIGVACADLLCTAAALYVLLPQDASIGFTAFAGLYLIAITAGVVSSVPGGVGVFESVLFLLLPAVPPDRLLGSLLAYRAIYYIVPFTVALVMLGVHEVWVHRGTMQRMLRPAMPLISAPDEHDLDQVVRIVRTSGDTTANLALLGDQNLLFNDEGSAFIMYQARSGSWIAMGDPVGPASARQTLARQFVERSEDMAAAAAFYLVTEDDLAIYEDLGLRPSLIAEEALVDLAEFSLEGAAREPLRRSHGRAVRGGVQFQVVPSAEVVAMLPRLRAVTDTWFADESGGQSLSPGYFDASYLRRVDCAVVERDGAILAFANLWCAGDREELSIDLLRFSESAPEAAIDLLLIESMLWGKARGFRRFNLGMACIEGLADHRLAPGWHKLGRLLQRHGGDTQQFEALREFKEKFGPRWRRRYQAAATEDRW